MSSIAVLTETLDWNRQKTLAYIEGLAKTDNIPAVLGWRPGPGRAHIAWQMMHIAATDDRHVYVRMAAPGGQPKNGEFVRRFGAGSVPDDDIPTLDAIKGYLATARADLHALLKTLDDGKLAQKPHDQAPWTYGEWLRVLAWHEAHHQGQAHLTFNLFKAAHGIK